MESLPQELIDQVIDSVDGTVVEACGLVSRRWLARSRLHLFSTLHLSNDTVHSFFHLVDSSPLPLLSFIRSLVLTFVGGPFEDAHMFRLHHCPALRDLGVRSQEYDDAFYAAMQAHIPRIAAGSSRPLSFGFQSDSGIPLPGLLDIVSHIPSLTAFRLAGVLRVSATHAAIQPKPLPANLRKVTLSVGRGEGAFFEALLANPSLPRFKSFTAGRCHGRGFKAEHRHLPWHLPWQRS